MHITEPAVIVPFLNGLASLLKRSPRIPDWQIPQLIVGAGAALMIGYSFAPGAHGFFLDYAIAGAMSGFSAVGVNQLIKQRTDGKKEWETTRFEKPKQKE